MTTQFFSIEQMAAVYKVEQDWLFEKLPGKLNTHRHLILAVDQGWGIQEYVSGMSIFWDQPATLPGRALILGGESPLCDR